MYGVIAVILVLGGLIFFHELGHFLAARSFGMGVQTFSLGFGPAIFSRKRGKTKYQVAAFPLGGYVALVGESQDAEIPEEFTPEESFSLRPAWQRFFVLAAGSVFNLLLAWIICWGLAWSNGRMVLPPVVGDFQEGGAAESSPLQKGDRILSIDGIRVETWAEMPPLVQRSGGKDMTITAQRPDESIVTFLMAPKPFEQSENSKAPTVWSMGIKSEAPEYQELGFFAAAGAGLDEAVRMGTLIWRTLGDLLTTKIEFSNVGGPILIAQTIYTQAEHGIANILMIAAFISVNLGIFNLLPIPVLDGGHLLFLLVEMAGRKPVPVPIQEKSMAVGLFLLLGLMVAATYNDVIRLFS